MDITSQIRRAPAQSWELFPRFQPAASSSREQISPKPLVLPQEGTRAPPPNPPPGSEPGCLSPQPLAPVRAIFCLIEFFSVFLIFPTPSGLLFCLLLKF